MYRKKDWYMFTILLNLTVSIMYTFDNMELKYGPLVLMLSSSLCMYSLENRAQPEPKVRRVWLVKTVNIPMMRRITKILYWHRA